MPWHQYSPALGMTPMNRSRLGLGAMGDPTEQYANDPYPSMQSSMLPTSPFSPFSMSSMLPLNKFSGYGMGNPWGGGMMNPWVQNPWANYQPTQWAGPNAFYPNWNDPAGPFANDVAMIGPLPVPTDPSLPPPVEVEGADEELQAARIARTKQVSENFYRNNPDHPLSRFDAALRKAFGVPQLGTAYNMGQGITPQTNWAGQGVTPQTSRIAETGRLAAQSVQAQRQEDARIAAAQKAAAAREAEQERQRQRTARTRSMGTRARGGRDSSGTSGPTGGMGGQGWT